MKLSNTLKYLFFSLFISIAASSSVLAAPVDVNSANADDLASALKGVGPKVASDIIAYRKEHGPFKSPEDLLNVKGFGPKTLERNKGDILVGDKAPAAVKK